MQPRDRDLHQPNFGIGTCDRRRRCGIYRRMEGEAAKCAQGVVGDDLVLCIKLTGWVALMKMAKRKELGNDNQDTGKEHKRLAPAPSRCTNSLLNRNHRPD